MMSTDWLSEGLAAKGLAPRTVRSYIGSILRTLRWCEANGYDIDSLPASGVSEWVAQNPPSWSTRHLLRCSLAHYWEIIGRADPPLAAFRRPPKPKGECRALEVGDAHILAKAARTRGDLKGLSVAISLYAATRREETASFRWASYDAIGGWLDITGKGDKTRHIPCHPKLAEMLNVTERRDEYLFPGRFGGHVTPATIWAWCREVSTDAGVPTIAPHVCRHIALATSNDNNRDIRATQDFAGHSSVETTLVYTRTTTKRLRAVVDSLDY